MDSEEVNTSTGYNGPSSKLICHYDMIYEHLIDSKFTLVYKSVLVITQGYIANSEQGL